MADAHELPPLPEEEWLKRVLRFSHRDCYGREWRLEPDDPASCAALGEVQCEGARAGSFHAALKQNPRLGNHVALHSLYLDHDFKGCRLGSTLMSYLHAVGAELGIHHLAAQATANGRLWLARPGWRFREPAQRYLEIFADGSATGVHALEQAAARAAQAPEDVAAFVTGVRGGELSTPADFVAHPVGRVLVANSDWVGVFQLNPYTPPAPRRVGRFG